MLTATYTVFCSFRTSQKSMHLFSLHLSSSLLIGARSRFPSFRRLSQTTQMAEPMTLAWAPVVMQAGKIVASLGPARTVAGKRFFKVSAADSCLRQLLVGYRSESKGSIRQWPLPQTLHETIVEKSTKDVSAEAAPVDAIFDADQSLSKHHKKRRLLKVEADYVELRCPPVAKMPNHSMWVLPIYAVKGRGSDSLWVEATKENIHYLTSAFDEWADGQDACASRAAPDATATAPDAAASGSVADIDNDASGDLRARRRLSDSAHWLLSGSRLSSTIAECSHCFWLDSCRSLTVTVGSVGP